MQRVVDGRPIIRCHTGPMVHRRRISARRPTRERILRREMRAFTKTGVSGPTRNGHGGAARVLAVGFARASPVVRADGGSSAD